MIRRDEAPAEGNGAVAEGDSADSVGGRDDRARRLAEEGRHTEAAELWRVVELDSGNPAAYLLLGEALNQLGDPDAAIEALEHALRLQPRNSRIYYALGISYDRKGVSDRAAEMYRHSRELGRG